MPGTVSFNSSMRFAWSSFWRSATRVTAIGGILDRFVLGRLQPIEVKTSDAASYSTTDACNIAPGSDRSLVRAKPKAHRPTLLAREASSVNALALLFSQPGWHSFSSADTAHSTLIIRGLWGVHWGVHWVRIGLVLKPPRRNNKSLNHEACRLYVQIVGSVHRRPWIIPCCDGIWSLRLL
jgi:hypothetical protein